MICALGIGLLGLFAFRQARRCGGGFVGWHGLHHHHGPARHRRRRWMFHRLLERIDATPAQERLIVGELDKLQERLRDARRHLRDVRPDLAIAVQRPTLDDDALGPVLARFDAVTAEARSALVEALRNVHATLDDKQKAEVAELLDHTGGGWWRGGPYR